jgi:serine/threonine-protein kinase
VVLRPGDKFDRYIIEQSLGQGGMGVVYRAHDPKLHRSVALKILAAKPHTEPSALESEGAARLLREARAAAAIDHPNAVAIFDVGEVDGVPFIAMERVDGQTLRAKMTDPSSTTSQKIGWLIDVAGALNAAHERGLVHRDVKPENVMVRHDGSAKVLDFGIARRAKTDAPPEERLSVPTITGEGVVVGTPLYMSPEQIRGDKLDGRSDQFSWGAMAYELLSGKLAWGTIDDGLKIVANILSRDPEPLDRVAAVPEKIAKVVQRALAKDPDDRFPSMRAASSALAAAAGLISGDTALAVTEMAAPTKTKRVSASSKRRLWVALGAIGLAVAGLAAWHQMRKVPKQGVTALPSASACKDFPIPESKSAESITAYRAAMQAFCDGNDPVPGLRQALERDPSLAVPHVYLGGSLFANGRVDDARHEIQAALQSRAALAPRDADYLSSIEPIVMRTPPDWNAALERLDGILVRSPNDPLFWFARSWVHLSVNDTEHAKADAMRAFELDPHFAFPWWCMAMAFHQEGKLAEETDALDQCVKAAPGSRLCAGSRAMAHARRGDCAAMKESGEQLIAMSPDDPTGYRLRNNALAQGGAETETLRAALAQWSKRVDGNLRENVRLASEEQLALWSGDFAAAEAASRAREHVVPESDLKAHSAVAWHLVQALLESGKVTEAGAVADAFVKKSDLWTLSVVAGVHGDMTPALLETAERTGAIPHARFITRRDAWIAKWTKMFPGKDDARAVLVAAWVMPVETRFEAEEAVAKLPELLPLTLDWDIDGDAVLAKAYHLAGRTDEALPYLARAAGACFALDMPIETTRASFMLGQARAEKGDKAGACAAYATVIERWGKAKPKSVTAEAAKQAASSIGCAP